MIKDFHQRHYKNAIMNVLENYGGEAEDCDAIDTLLNNPSFKIELNEGEREQKDPSGSNALPP